MLHTYVATFFIHFDDILLILLFGDSYISQLPFLIHI